MEEKFQNRIDIKSSFKTYSVTFLDTLDSLRDLAEQRESFFVIDRKVYELYKNNFSEIPSQQLFLLDAEEDKKNIHTVLDICEQMTAMPSKRNTHLISVGGGIVQDLTGFVATSLYRGVRWTFYPTTLLAASDSCIGGKSSLNYKGFKNLLGSFYPPDNIFIYPHFFRTLTPRDYCSGLGEVVKFNVIAGENGLDRIEHDLEDILQHDYKKLIEYVKSSLEFKKNFIEEDEFDRGVRILLNFAHTFGHAYEVVSEYKIPHGSAVALGMITANYISVQRGFLSPEYAARIEVLCQRILQNIEKRKEWFVLERILQAIHKDKKQISTAISAVLIKKDYSLGIFQDVKEEEIAKAMDHLFD